MALEVAKGEETTNEALIGRILAVNFAAIHATSMVSSLSIYPRRSNSHCGNKSFTHALYYLASSPEFAELLREEIDVIVREYGWTKGGLDQMKKVDSCLRESQRLQPVKNGEHLEQYTVRIKPVYFLSHFVICSGPRTRGTARSYILRWDIRAARDDSAHKYSQPAFRRVRL